jgi:hypothetical protein
VRLEELEHHPKRKVGLAPMPGCTEHSNTALAGQRAYCSNESGLAHSAGSLEQHDGAGATTRQAEGPGCQLPSVVSLNEGNASRVRLDSGWSVRARVRRGLHEMRLGAVQFSRNMGRRATSAPRMPSRLGGLLLVSKPLVEDVRQPSPVEIRQVVEQRMHGELRRFHVLPECFGLESRPGVVVEDHADDVI